MSRASRLNPPGKSELISCRPKGGPVPEGKDSARPFSATLEPRQRFGPTWAGCDGWGQSQAELHKCAYTKLCTGG